MLRSHSLALTFFATLALAQQPSQLTYGNDFRYFPYTNAAASYDKCSKTWSPTEAVADLAGRHFSGAGQCVDLPTSGTVVAVGIDGFKAAYRGKMYRDGALPPLLPPPAPAHTFHTQPQPSSSVPTKSVESAIASTSPLDPSARPSTTGRIECPAAYLAIKERRPLPILRSNLSSSLYRMIIRKRSWTRVSFAPRSLGFAIEMMQCTVCWQYSDIGPATLGDPLPT